jgi:hypothetical protein
MRWGIQDANEAEATTWNQGNYLVMRGIVPIEPEDEAKEKTKKPHGMLPSALPFSTGRLKRKMLRRTTINVATAFAGYWTRQR